MKKVHFLILLSSCLLASCNNYEPTSLYVYNANPLYTWGYAEFYGAYYEQYGIKNNTISLSLFSDSLKVNDQNVLEGTGQYLFLEDVFVSPTDTLLPDGIYKISKTEAADPMTFYAGQNDTIDSEVYPIGAYISYYEENTAKSTYKLISDGTFTVSRRGTNYSITCDFVTSDSLKLKGSFNAILPHIDQSLKPQKTVSPVRRRTMTNLL
jgi:hypothetical protein